MADEIRAAEMVELTKPNNVTDLTYGGAEVIFPNPAYPRQAMFCKLKMEGYGRGEIMEELGIDQILYSYYTKRFKPFVMRKLVELREMRKGGSLLIIQQQIHRKLKEVEDNPEKDTTSLLDWVEVGRKYDAGEVKASAPHSFHPIINIIDNREQVKTIDAQVVEEKKPDGC